jgi:hypothetical protein
MILLEPITFHIINIIWQLANYTSIKLELFHKEGQIRLQKHSENLLSGFIHFMILDAKSLHNNLRPKLNVGKLHSLKSLLLIGAYQFAIFLEDYLSNELLYEVSNYSPKLPSLFLLTFSIFKQIIYYFLLNEFELALLRLLKFYSLLNSTGNAIFYL